MEGGYWICVPQNESYGEEQRVDPSLAQPGAPGGIRQVM